MAKLSDFPQAMAGIRTSLPPEQRSASYDRLALGYDWLVGNGLYNRLVWGCPKSAYRRHADTFLDRTGPGEILDFGCGSLVHRAELVLESIVRDLPPVYQTFYADTAARTCPNCGELHPGKEPPEGWVKL